VVDMINTPNTDKEAGMPTKRITRAATPPTTYRLTLRLPGELIYRLKARAAAERITASALVGQWVRSWPTPETRRPGGRP
jgi:predicted DNA binding CopG/RHH family protein